jgi:hypothetical protein
MRTLTVERMNQLDACETEEERALLMHTLTPCTQTSKAMPPELRRKQYDRNLADLITRIHRRMCGVTADLVWVGPKVEHLRKPPTSAEIDRMMDLSAKLTARK